MKFIKYEKSLRKELNSFYNIYILNDKSVFLDSFRDHFWDNIDNNPNVTLWIAEKDSKWIGLLAVREFRNECYSKGFSYQKSKFDNKTCVEFCHDFVIKEYRGKHLQQKFIEFREKSIETDCFAATILKDNKSSINNYKRMGFELIGTPLKCKLLNNSVEFILVVKDYKKFKV